MDEHAKATITLSTMSDIDNIDFSMLAQDVPVMLWMTNSAGKMLFSNSLDNTFFGHDNIVAFGDKVWAEALHPEDKNCLTIFFEAFSAQRPFVMEYRLKRHDSEYRYMLDKGQPYFDRDGHFSGFMGASTDITERRLSEDALKKSHQDLIQYNHEMSLINQLNTYLQVCRSLNETYPVIVHYAEQIFPDWLGGLYLYNDKRSCVESVASWGVKPISSIDMITPDECWALRQGKAHNGIDIVNRLRCHHTQDQVDSYACTPVIAQGEMLGMLYMEYCGDTHFKSAETRQRYFDSRQRLMKTTADNLAMSLVSLNLREVLKHQSIRDPLTSLFNRRYMEASLEREIIRCERSGEGIGVILVDIDYFKQFNDNYGHDAGDLVLIEFAKFMTTYFRQSDIVCRFGGEEFIVIIPSAPQHLVVERATQLCHRLHDLSVYYDSKRLPGITASFGVSYLPANDQSQAANIVKLADAALYAAKRAGRDQVALYDVLLHNVRD